MLHAARSTVGLSLAAHSLEKSSSNGYPFRSLSDSIQIRAAGARARRNHVGQTIRIDCPELCRSSASAGTKYVRKAFHVSAFALGANAWIPPSSRQRQCGRNSPITSVHGTETLPNRHGWPYGRRHSESLRRRNLASRGALQRPTEKRQYRKSINYV